MAIDKTQWPPGPWQDEPDERRWTDELTGLPCWLIRHPLGHWCGYVGVDECSTTFGFACDKTSYSIDEVLAGAANEAYVQSQINEIGHLNFASDKLDDSCWWFGFDCGHAGDYSPGTDKGQLGPNALGKPTGFLHPSVVTYVTIDEAATRCVEIAAKLAAVHIERDQ